LEYIYLRAWRDELGWTQKQLSDATKIPRSTISETENRNHNPSKDELKKIAAALGITVEQLYEMPKKKP